MTKATKKKASKKKTKKAAGISDVSKTATKKKKAAKKKTTKKKTAAAKGQIVKTQKEAAKYSGKDERTIRRWVEAGMPTVEGGGYYKGVLDLYKKNGGKNYEEDKSRAATAEANYKETKAKLLEIELKIKTGQLLDAEKVKETQVKKVSVLKRVLRSIPRTVANQITPGMSNRKIQDLMLEYIDQCIREFAGGKE